MKILDDFSAANWSSFTTEIVYIIPGTQMTIALLGKDLLSEGKKTSPQKPDIQRFQVGSSSLTSYASFPEIPEIRFLATNLNHPQNRSNAGWLISNLSTHQSG